MVMHQVLSNSYLEATSDSSFIQFLELMQQNIQKKLQELETRSMKNQHKQIKRLVEDFEDSKPDRFQDTSSNLIKFRKVRNEHNVRILSKLREKVSETPLVKDLKSLYESSVKQLHSRTMDLIKQWILQSDKGNIDQSTCISIFQLMEVTFSPDVLVLQDQSIHIDDILEILKLAHKMVGTFQSNKFIGILNTIRKNIKPRFELLMLNVAHENFLKHFNFSDHDFQRKSICAYTQIAYQKSIEDVKKTFKSCFPHQKKPKLIPFKKTSS